MDLSVRLAASRSDRIIALARLPLGLFIVMAIWLDPTQPTRVPELTYLLSGGYLLFSAVTAALLFRPASRPWLAVIAHFVDLGVFTFLVYTTEGPASPFFLLFTFSIVSAAFRWRWRGALWTSLAVLALQILSAAVFARYVPGTVFEMDRFLIRTAHVAVTGGMLVYFAYHRERIADQLSLLRPPPAGPWYETERDDFIQKCAAHLGDIIGASRIAFIADEPEEPSAGAHIWADGEMRRERIAAAIFDRLMLLSPAAPTWIEPGPAWKELTRPAHDASAAAAETRFEAFLDGLPEGARVLSVPVPSDYSRCKLFIADPRGGLWDVAVMADLLARQIADGLDRIETAGVQGRGVLAEERLSLARDLHDGILQTLAGTALQLENIARRAETDPAGVAARIRTLQDWLVAEQREVRRLIRRLRPGRAEKPDVVPPNAGPFQELAQGLQYQWNLEVSVTTRDGEVGIPPELDHHLQQIIREAAANSARHGGASKLDVAIGHGQGGLDLVISDNGSGIPAQPTSSGYDGGPAAEGPRSLRERVARLGGTLEVDNSASGVRLDIHIPAIKSGAA